MLQVLRYGTRTLDQLSKTRETVLEILQRLRQINDVHRTLFGHGLVGNNGLQGAHILWLIASPS